VSQWRGKDKRGRGKDKSGRVRKERDTKDGVEAATQ